MLNRVVNILITVLIGLTLASCGGDSQGKKHSITIQAPEQVNELTMVSMIVAINDKDMANQELTYQWQQTSGGVVELITPLQANVQFLAPEVINDEVLSFSVEVKNSGKIIVNKEVNILVSNINKLPVIILTAPEQVLEQSNIELQAEVSDLDGSIAGILWRQTFGIEVVLTAPNSPIATITLPEIESDELISFNITAIDNDGGISEQEITILIKHLTLAQSSSISSKDVIEQDSHESIFISSFDINIEAQSLASVAFTIIPATNSSAAAIKASYPIANLVEIEQGINLPIFGLYRGATNIIELAFTFIDGSIKTINSEVTTATNIIPLDSLYNSYSVTKRPDVTSPPSFAYMLMKSSEHGPVIVDIDGNVRWQTYLDEVVTFKGHSSLYHNGMFKVAISDELYSLHLDGKTTSVAISHPDLTNISAHHELSLGKTGYLVAIDADKNNIKERVIESILIEVTEDGSVINEWDFNDIFTNYLIEHGEDPDQFVRHGIDWFHMNSAVYNKADDSLIVSSRENFIVKIDYKTKVIKWLFGDESKHWFVNFLSLQVLSLYSTAVKPIGQHALSMVNNELMMFNNGQLSFKQPENMPAGKALTSSFASRYKIDETNMNAELSWQYDSGIFSDVCSSIYQDPSEVNGDYLVNFASVNRLNSDPLHTLIQGINEHGDLLFEFKFEFPTPCVAAWNTSIVEGLNDLQMIN